MNHGQVFQINVSDGGVPKLPQQQADAEALGLTTDTQRNTKVHGGLDKAICLYPVERIAALQKEGHPIYPGSIGENLTVIGIDWETMVIGSRWQIGADVQIEITSYAYPCKFIGASFVNQKFMRVEQGKNPGWARAYAAVLQTGTIRLGDQIQELG